MPLTGSCQSSSTPWSRCTPRSAKSHVIPDQVLDRAGHEDLSGALQGDVGTELVADGRRWLNESNSKRSPTSPPSTSNPATLTVNCRDEWVGEAPFHEPSEPSVVTDERLEIDQRAVARKGRRGERDGLHRSDAGNRRTRR